MEYVFSSIIVLLFFRYGVPVIIQWFFGNIVEPREKTRKEFYSQQRPDEALTNLAVQKKDLANDLAELKRKLK